MIISVVGGKTFGKIHILMIKTHNKLNFGENFFSEIKGFIKSTVKIVQYKRLKAFPLRTGTIMWKPIFFHFYSTLYQEDLVE